MQHWHVAVFLACVKIPTAFFDATKSRYLPKKWEKGGRWYRDNLKIQLWKDKLPQHIGKGGFSKAHLTDVSIEYLDEFIMETCRGEWMHLTNCLCGVVMLAGQFPRDWASVCVFDFVGEFAVCRDPTV